MNKRVLTLIAAGLALGCSWTGCKKSEKTIVAGPAPTVPVELKLKWPVGRTLVQNMDIQQTSRLFVPSVPAPIQQDMTMGQRFRLTVLNERTDGGHEVEMEFLSMRMKISTGTQPVMDFDSSNKSPGTNPVAVAFQKLTGVRVRFFLDESNDVWKVEGVDEVQKRLASGAQSDPTGIVNSMFGEDYFKQMMSYSKSLPPGPVEPGNSWPVRMEIAMGNLGTLIMDHTYTFKAWERRDEHNCARIEYTGTVKSKPDSNPKTAGMNILIPEGKTSGETWFDMERGAFVDTVMNQDMKMFITVPNQGGGKTPTAARPMVITNLMTQAVTVKLESVK